MIRPIPEHSFDARRDLALQSRSALPMKTTPLTFSP
jgi:hypothetical protein